jgi:Ca2+-binding RTX toxin-like protein
VGNNLENTLTGNDGNNYLSGLDGGDLLVGAGGRDTLDGGIGDDTLNGGGFDGVADILQGGVGNDVYVVDSVIDQIVDFVGGEDRVLSSVSYDLSSTLVSGIEVLELIGVDSISGIGDAFSNTLIGNIANNSLNGGGEQDTIIGGAGDDTLYGGILDDKKDSLIGGEGDDLYIIDSEIDKISEKDGEGTDTIETTSSINLQNLSGDSDGAQLSIENIVLSQKLIGIDRNINATGNAIANSLVGNKGNNILDGGEDAIADTLIGNGGNDIFKGGRLGVGDYLWGGEDDDTYDVESDKDYINDDGGIDIVKSSVSFNLSSENVSGLEHLIYSGSDSARLTGNISDNSLISQGANSDELDGGSGNDTLDGGRGGDIFSGGDGDDFFVIDNEADVIVELDEDLSGFDTALIQSRDADETAKYALEVDSNVENLLYVGASESSLEGSRFDNRIQGSNNQNTLLGHDGNDYLIGGALADSLIGGKGNDTLDGKMGTDILDGGEGDDLYFVNFQSTKIEDAAGTDTVRSTATYSLNYNGGLSRIEGLELLGSANINATGNSLANTLVGNDGSNQIDANEGDDTVLGGLGADVLRGGAGNDSMIGGGNPQGDLPADAATPISIVSGQAYTGFIESRQDTDWIKVTLSQGIKYSFSLKRVLDGPTALKRNSDIAFGVPWDNEGIIWNFPEQVLFDEDGNKAYGDFENLSSDDSSITEYKKQFGNIYSFEFTPYDSGEFYIPISGAGPALGSYTVTVEDSSISGVNLPSFADTASNTLVGGLGRDTLISGNGRDAKGNAFGDLLLGGTNGMFGSIDSDTEDDTLIGGDGADTLDGGLGNNSLIGGNGNDLYFTRSRGDIIREKLTGGTADIVVVGFSDASGGWDIDLDLENYKYIEGVTLQGGADLRVIGNDVANTIVGNLGDNSMSGAGGDDSLLGAGGNDTLDGAEGDDYLDGGSGVNSMIGGLGRDTYIINDRNDRVIETEGGISGGVDFIRTYFNFDPIQGTALEQFQPDVADNSPSVTKSPSFASKDLNSFYKLENFELLGEAAYGVGNAFGNSLIAGKSAALLLGMGGEDSLIGNIGSDSLFGDTPDFYADPDLYAPTPTDTRAAEFISGVVGVYGSDYLSGGEGDDYLDGGKGFDTMIGGAGSNVFVQDHTDDYINADGGSGNELISSVNISSIPDNISRIMLVVKEQERIDGKFITGQEQVASFASFLGSKGGNDQAGGISVGGVSFGVEDANILEQLYGTAMAEVFSNLSEQDRQPKGHLSMVVSQKFADPNNNAKVAYDLSWAAIDSGDHAEHDPIIGYNISYREKGSDHWRTYVNGSSQDLQGTTANPSLTIYNLDPDIAYEFLAEGRRRSVPVTRDANGNATGQLVATLQGGAGNDQVSSVRLIRELGLHSDANLDPYIWNNILDPLPSAFLFAPLPVDVGTGMRQGYATYLDGGFGNDLLCGWEINDSSGLDYELSIKQWSETGVTAAEEKITFRGLNTLVGGQGSDTFIVRNGGQAIGDEFDWVIKYGNETPVDYGSGGFGNSLNGGQHNVVASAVNFLTLSDTEVHQGMFIDQLALAYYSQFGMGNRLDNYIYDGKWIPSAENTLVGAGGRDSIVGNSSMDVLIGGNAYGLDNVGFSIKDFASVADGGNGLLTSIFRDTDPIPVQPNASGAADLSQFWSMPGFYKYGEVFDLDKNRDTLVGFATSDAGLTLDGGAGSDSMVGSSKGDTFYTSRSSALISRSGNLISPDIIKGNGGGDTVIFTDSDYLWWTGHEEGALLLQNYYSIDKTDLSNLTLQMGAPTAREAIGNDTANTIIGNEFDNVFDGKGVGASGIDFLVGDGRVDTNSDDKIDDADRRGHLSSDNFIVDTSKGEYKKSTTWKPEVVTTDISTTVESIDPITGVKTTTKIPKFKHEWDSSKSVYLDEDFVVIEDFEADTDFIDPVTGVRTAGGGNPDNLELFEDLSSYSIGRLPSTIDPKKLGSIKVGPQGKEDITGGEFGIYYTGNQTKWESEEGPEAPPNLVAVIRSSDSLLLDRAVNGQKDGVFNPDLDLDARPSFPLSTQITDSAVADPLMGWGQFYQLDTSNFAQYINNYGGMSDSTANLSALMNQIV